MTIDAYPEGTDLADAVLASARASGCNCQPVVEAPNRRTGITHVAVRHDDWCRLLAQAERRN